MTSAAISHLQQACSSNTLSTSASLSPDGRTLTIGETAHDATALITVPLGSGNNKSVTYSLASLYLLLSNPSVLQYRKACEAANVTDVVKILDKAGVQAYFFGGAEAGQGGGGEGDTDEHAMDVSDHEGEAKSTLAVEERDEGQEHRSKRHDDKDRPNHRSSKRHDKAHRMPSSKSHKAKHDEEDHKKKAGKSAAPITNEQLVANLSTIVDKRDKPKSKPVESTAVAGVPVATTATGEQHPASSTADALDSRQITPSTTPVPTAETGHDNNNDEREMLLASLSPEGFDVHSPEVMAAIEADREAVRRITALEIPVGDSSSILRAGAGGEIVEGTNTTTNSGSGGGNVKKRDFSRVLEIYQEVLQAEEKAKRTSFADGKRPAPPGPTAHPSTIATTSTPIKKIEGNPIIIVPNAMTSCITLVNAGFFLGKEATFLPRDAAIQRPDAGKRGNTLRITRKLAARLGGGEITYDIIDNPTTRLKKDDWERVVAVIAQGASWQFKGWRYSDPVELFSRAFGFYVGYEGAAVPTELLRWNVKLGKVSRDRRGLDNICLASFWNG
ncbi:hypothetical protein HJC23_004315 [Cyclotella cryptica]|uniref:Cell division control protein 73 C-terminal domain-containing protein n=1 Tax=Cyclotella cryptica TaxID=29204 RepID=A0ABD3Q3L1_9STRA